MFDELDKYKTQDHFFFKPNDSLISKCNAPVDKSGVYLVYGLSKGKIELLYIGRSGKKNEDGTIKNRVAGIGGIKDRIVNGKHFNKVPRRHSWPLQMKKENLEALDVYWYVTFDDYCKDCPKEIESLLLQKHLDIFGHLPRWNKVK